MQVGKIEDLVPAGGKLPFGSPQESRADASMAVMDRVYDLGNGTAYVEGAFVDVRKCFPMLICLDNLPASLA